MFCKQIPEASEGLATGLSIGLFSPPPSLSKLYLSNGWTDFYVWGVVVTHIYPSLFFSRYALSAFFHFLTNWKSLTVTRSESWSKNSFWGVEKAKFELGGWKWFHSNREIKNYNSRKDCKKKCLYFGSYRLFFEDRFSVFRGLITHVPSLQEWGAGEGHWKLF